MTSTTCPLHLTAWGGGGGRGVTLQPQLAPAVGIVSAPPPRLAHPDVDPEPQIDEKSITHGCLNLDILILL